MPCPTCNHTMANLGLDQAGRRAFWCRRCGTVKNERDMAGDPNEDGTSGPVTVYSEIDTPFLVARVKRLLELLPQSDINPNTVTRECWAAWDAVRQAAGG